MKCGSYSGILLSTVVSVPANNATKSLELSESMMSLSQYMSIKADSRSSLIVLFNLFFTIFNFEKLHSLVAEVNAIVAATTNAM
jgi:hypothetical protein